MLHQPSSSSEVGPLAPEGASEAVTKTRPTILNILRGAASVASAVPLVLPIDAAAYTALVPRAIPGAWERVRGRYQELSRVYATFLQRVSLQFLLGVKTKIEGDVPEFSGDETAIYFANHPTTSGVGSIPWFVTRHLLPRLIQISKRGNLYTPMAPLIGWPLALMDGGIFIDRDRRDSAFHSIQQGCRRLLKPGSGILIYPDKRRPVPARIAEAQRDPKWRARIPDIDDWRYALPPHAGGLHQLLAATRDMDPLPRVVDFTVAFDRPHATIFDTPHLVGATQYIYAEEVTDEIPHDAPELGQWLIERWREKQSRIAAWRA